MGRPPEPGEPRWSAEDRALAVEWQRLQGEQCGGCGQPLEQSLDERSQYEVHDLVCFACQAKEQTERALSENDNADTAGRKVAVVYAGRDSDPIPALTPPESG